MRTAILRLVCDDCGFIGQFETMNSEPLTATTDVQGMVDRAGWNTTPKMYRDGGGSSKFSTHDRCPWCGGPGVVTRDGEILSTCPCRH